VGWSLLCRTFFVCLAARRYAKCQKASGFCVRIDALESQNRWRGQIKEEVAMRTFIVRTLIAAVAALATVIVAGPANSEPKDDPIAWITQYEHDAAAADLAGDVSFYQKNLADDWSDGMSTARFKQGVSWSRT